MQFAKNFRKYIIRYIMSKYEIRNGIAIIPEDETVIAREAFRGCEELTSVVIPQSVTEIRGLAFYGCKGLTSIVIPKSVVSIGLDAFTGCSNLNSIVVEDGNPIYDSRGNWNAIIEKGSATLVRGCSTTTIPEGVEIIGKSAFSNCKGLTSIALPSSIKEIQNEAFFDCTALAKLFIPKSLIQIGRNDVFANCTGLTNIVVEDGNPVYDSRENCNAIIENGESLILGCCNSIIPNGVKTIARSAFRGCAITSVTIPDTVVKIEAYAFSHCSMLSEVVIPNDVEIIEQGAFVESGLVDIVVPEKVRNLHGVFCRCHKLISATVKGKLDDFRSDCTFPFMNCTSLEIITFLDCVRYIKDESCNGCKSLKSIYVPAKKGDYYKKRFTEELHPIIVELEPIKKPKK